MYVKKHKNNSPVCSRTTQQYNMKNVRAKAEFRYCIYDKFCRFFPYIFIVVLNIAEFMVTMK